jgi:predicted secreted hydrolase
MIYLMFLYCVLRLNKQEAFGEDFAHAEKGKIFTFPKEHGAHEQFQTEWWYYTGLLFAEGKRPYFDLPQRGFQLTFFRRKQGKGKTSWDQYYLAHATLSNFSKGEFLIATAETRGGVNIAYASPSMLRVYHKGMSAEEIGGEHVLSSSFEKGTVLVRLLAHPESDPILQGDKGYSRKCDDPGVRCASHYYSIPKLSLKGHVIQGEKREDVTGTAWMDHEFMTNLLQKDQVGWDWFSLNCNNGLQYMLYKVRTNTEKDNYSYGAIIKEGKAYELNRNDFAIEELSHEKSSQSGAYYPSRWKLTLPLSSHLDLKKDSLVLTPLMKDQELFSKDSKLPAYWEGAVTGVFTLNGRDKITQYDCMGFVEMTGYDTKMQGNL